MPKEEKGMTAAQAKKLHERLDSQDKRIKQLEKERDAALKKAAKAAEKQEEKEEPEKETPAKEEKPKKGFLSRLMGG